jgi:hypothetical protein
LIQALCLISEIETKIFCEFGGIEKKFLSFRWFGGKNMEQLDGE